MNLKKLQQNFQAYILNNNTEITGSIRAPKNLSSSESMQIYQNGYHVRIIQAMTRDFPLLREQLGESAFAGLIGDYLQSYPPCDYNLRYVGRHLSEFIMSRDHSFAPYAALAQREYTHLQNSQEAPSEAHAIA